MDLRRTGRDHGQRCAKEDVEVMHQNGNLSEGKKSHESGSLNIEIQMKC